MNKRIVGLVLVSCLFLLVASTVRAGSVEGAWELKRYSLAGDWIEVSGLLILNKGTFAMIYAMESEAGSQSGRAHAGTYRVEDNRLIFDVKLWIQKVGDTAAVISPKTAGAEIELTGDELILHFDGGSIQVLERSRAEGLHAFDGTWHLKDAGRHEENTTDQPASGLLVAAANRFVAVYLDGGGDRGYARGGKAENINSDGKLDVLWEVRVNGDAGSVSAGVESRYVQVETSENSLSLRDADGTVLRFRD